jgi:hypothetical protein
MLRVRKCKCKYAIRSFKLKQKMKTKKNFLIKNIQFLRPNNNALPFHEVGLNFIYLINLLSFRLAHWVPCLVKTLAG